MSTPMPISQVTVGELISGASLIYTIISGLIGIILFLIWRAALELKDNIRELFTIHRTCRDEMRKEFPSNLEFNYFKQEVETLKEDRKEKWKEYFAHYHNENGKVELPR